MTIKNFFAFLGMISLLTPFLLIFLIPLVFWFIKLLHISVNGGLSEGSGFIPLFIGLYSIPFGIVILIISFLIPEKEPTNVNPSNNQSQQQIL